MHHLGKTRSAREPDHLLQTPDTFVRAALPGMRGATAIVHASPQIGARFVEYTAGFQPDGILCPAGTQRFLYVLGGQLEVCGQRLGIGDFAYAPQGSGTEVRAINSACASVIEKPYQSNGGAEPG